MNTAQMFKECKFARILCDGLTDKQLKAVTYHATNQFGCQDCYTNCDECTLIGKCTECEWDDEFGIDVYDRADWKKIIKSLL